MRLSKTISVRYLWITALGILALPSTIFWFAWLKPYFAIVVVGAIVLLCSKATEHLWRDATSVTISLPSALAALLALLIWVGLSGIGGFAFQNSDYLKHNAVYYELVNQVWPPRIQGDFGEGYLVYYLSYYILPALTGKLGGFSALQYAAYFQAVLGISICALCIKTLLAGSSCIGIVPIVLALMAWGGLDIIGLLIFSDPFYAFGGTPEWWPGTKTFQYTGFTDLLFWVPQHMLGGWLMTLLSLRFLFNRYPQGVFLVLALGLTWTPIVCLGMLPFLVIAAGQLSRMIRTLQFSRVPTLSVVTGLAIFALCFVYYSGVPDKPPMAWQWTRMGLDSFMLRYLSFIALEFGLAAVPILMFRDELPEFKAILALGLPLLCFLPMIYYGIHSDLSSRGSIPMLLIVFIGFFRTYWKWGPQTNGRALFFGYLLLISFSSLSDLRRAHRFRDSPTRYGDIHSIYPADIKAQYIGKPNHLFSVFFRQANHTHEK